jgi:UDP-N-acetylglucosamine 4,6-dehydratase
VPFFNKLIAEGASELPITDVRMTRFWITLEHGVDFVMKSFARMQGGEVFVPKIPSIRIVDLAQAMAADLPHKLVGIRPGEKLHELMVPLDDARMTLEFADHYTIVPSIRFNNVDADFSLDGLGEQGRAVADEFEYRSDTNPHFLTVEQIAALHADIKP